MAPFGLRGPSPRAPPRTAPPGQGRAPPSPVTALAGSTEARATRRTAGLRGGGSECLTGSGVPAVRDGHHAGRGGGAGRETRGTGPASVPAWRFQRSGDRAAARPAVWEPRRRSALGQRRQHPMPTSPSHSHRRAASSVINSIDGFPGPESKTPVGSEPWPARSEASDREPAPAAHSRLPRARGLTAVKSRSEVKSTLWGRGPGSCTVIFSSRHTKDNPWSSPQEHRHVLVLLETAQGARGERHPPLPSPPLPHQCQSLGPGGTAGCGSDTGGAARAPPPTCWDPELPDFHLSVHPPSTHIPCPGDARATDKNVPAQVQQPLCSVPNSHCPSQGPTA